MIAQSAAKLRNINSNPEADPCLCAGGDPAAVELQDALSAALHIAQLPRATSLSLLKTAVSADLDENDDSHPTVLSLAPPQLPRASPRVVHCPLLPRLIMLVHACITRNTRSLNSYMARTHNAFFHTFHTVGHRST